MMYLIRTSSAPPGLKVCEISRLDAAYLTECRHTHITTLAVSLRFALSSLPVVELYFGWPGMGFYLMRSIALRDDNLTVPLLLTLGILFILINWLVEFLYGRFDPRLRSHTTAQIDSGDSLTSSFKDLLLSLRDALFALPVLRRFWPTNPDLDQFYASIKQKSDDRGIYQVDESARKQERRKAWIKGTLYNPPFMVGMSIVLGLLIILVAGPDSGRRIATSRRDSLSAKAISRCRPSGRITSTAGVQMSWVGIFSRLFWREQNIRWPSPSQLCWCDC